MDLSYSIRRVIEFKVRGPAANCTAVKGPAREQEYLVGDDGSPWLTARVLEPQSYNHPSSHTKFSPRA